MSGNAPIPGTRTITAHLESPDLCDALQSIFRAFEDAEFMRGPSYNLLAAKGKHGKPSASVPPPGGEQSAEDVCRWLLWRARDMAAKVDGLYVDPAQSARLREMRRQHRRLVTVENGHLVAHRTLAAAITTEGDAS